jgi:hypothetical protein
MTMVPDRKGLIKIISTSIYFLVIIEINKYLVDMILINYFRSGSICGSIIKGESKGLKGFYRMQLRDVY